MPQPMIRFYHSLVDPSRATRRRERRDHDFEMLDARSAADHRIAITRSRDQGGPGCPYCDPR